jgi:long-chain acyl-CoA synthetase
MDRPWLQHYPSGMPANIDAAAYPRLMDMVEECFEKYRTRRLSKSL